MQNNLNRTSYANRQEWLAGRMHGIGASDASAIVGLSPWLTATELWKQKRGLIRPKDISGNTAVDRGNRIEPILRTLYATMYAETVEYHQLDILYQRNRPWLFATLDGELTDDAGRRGILEIKSATCSSRKDWEAWDGKVPRHYFCQLLHQFLATGYEYAVLFACLFNREYDMTIRRYVFERSEHEADLWWLLEKEETFWDSVQTRTLPPVQIIF